MIRTICVAAIAATVCAGCANVTETEYYEDGQIKRVLVDKSFNPRWSDGPNKQLPLSNISLSGVGGNAGGVVTAK